MQYKYNHKGLLKSKCNLFDYYVPYSTPPLTELQKNTDKMLDCKSLISPSLYAEQWSLSSSDLHPIIVFGKMLSLYSQFTDNDITMATETPWKRAGGKLRHYCQSKPHLKIKKLNKIVLIISSDLLSNILRLQYSFECRSQSIYLLFLTVGTLISFIFPHLPNLSLALSNTTNQKGSHIHSE